jgi:hypothetical protein
MYIFIWIIGYKEKSQPLLFDHQNKVFQLQERGERAVYYDCKKRPIEKY